MFDIILFLVIILCGLVIGSLLEKKHYTSIIEREKKYKNIIIVSDNDLKGAKNIDWDGVLMSGWTAVSIDAFKKLMAGFVNFFGGRVKSYESLVDRARREAILRLKEKAKSGWYNCLANLRVETSSITKNAKQSVWSVEAFAYATAIKLTQAWK